jgi:hypothetical protein
LSSIVLCRSLLSAGGGGGGGGGAGPPPPPPPRDVQSVFTFVIIDSSRAPFGIEANAG